MKYPAPINNPNPIKTLLVWQLCKANHIRSCNERSLLTFHYEEREKQDTLPKTNKDTKIVE